MSSNTSREVYPKHPTVLPSIRISKVLVDGATYYELPSISNIVKIDKAVDCDREKKANIQEATVDEDLVWAAREAKLNVLKSRAVLKTYSQSWKG